MYSKYKFLKVLIASVLLVAVVQSATATNESVNIAAGGYNHYVKVFHFLIDHWGQSSTGLQQCGEIHCEWSVSDHLKHLRDNMHYFTPPPPPGANGGAGLITVSLYNIHSWWERMRDTKPAFCELHTNLTMAETEESFVRYSNLFDQSFKNFDGFSSTHPTAAVQRIYKDALLNNSDLDSISTRNFSSLIKGASYVASDCHRRDSANANRDSVVQELRNLGLRVDGLGRCMHSPTGPEGVSLPKTRDTRYNLHLKRNAIGHYMFNLAFENSLESGYVTEKPFDALLAGTVPIYLGDGPHLKSILPHPKAAILISDFQNLSALISYVNYLMGNESAYEEHRAWRNDFSYQANVRGRPIMENSWFCRICEWAVKEAPKHHKRTRLCLPPEGSDKKGVSIVPQKLTDEWEGQAVRFTSSKQVYLVKDGVLRPIPDMDTFIKLKLDLGKIKVMNDAHLEYLIVGDEMPKTS